MDNKQIGTGLGTLVIVIVIGSLIWYLWKYDSISAPVSPVETQNFSEKITRSPDEENNVYLNSKHGFSIKMAGGWTYREFSSGAAFQLKNKPRAAENEAISINVVPRMGGTQNIPFEVYVKTAAPQEIQNYKSLSSMEKITTKSGLIGYKTTWKIAPMTVIGANIKPTGIPSSPIIYFDSKNSRKDTIQLRCDKEFIGVCDEMALTFELK